MMLEWAHSRKLFVHVLLTKSDKLNRGPASKSLQEVKAALKKMKLNFSIQLFSSLNKQGLEELASVMAGRLNFTLEQSNSFDLDSIPEASEDDIEMDLHDDLDDDAENIDTEMTSTEAEEMPTQEK